MALSRNPVPGSTFTGYIYFLGGGTFIIKTVIKENHKVPMHRSRDIRHQYCKRDFFNPIPSNSPVTTIPYALKFRAKLCSLSCYPGKVCSPSSSYQSKVCSHSNYLSKIWLPSYYTCKVLWPRYYPSQEGWPNYYPYKVCQNLYG